MKTTALVTLECATGLVRRYFRTAGNKPSETGRLEVTDWDLATLDDPEVQTRFLGFLQSWRMAWTPPEDPGPRPTSPLRNQMARAA